MNSVGASVIIKRSQTAHQALYLRRLGPVGSGPGAG